MLDTTKVGLLKSVEHLLSEIFIPALRNMDHGWGDMASPQSQTVKHDFISSLESFVSVLAGAQECLQEKVKIITLIHIHFDLGINICVLTRCCNIAST